MPTAAAVAASLSLCTCRLSMSQMQEALPVHPADDPIFAATADQLPRHRLSGWPCLTLSFPCPCRPCAIPLATPHDCLPWGPCLTSQAMCCQHTHECPSANYAILLPFSNHLSLQLPPPTGPSMPLPLQAVCSIAAKRLSLHPAEGCCTAVQTFHRLIIQAMTLWVAKRLPSIALPQICYTAHAATQLTVLLAQPCSLLPCRLCAVSLQ